MDIKLSNEQQALLKIMEETKQHLFITGRAGAGKSVLLRHFRQETKKRVVVAAPTGIAALNVRGSTLHSLFRLPARLHQPGSLASNPRVCTLLKRIDTLIIDEISMVRADLLDAVDERLREAFDTDIPFGGVQVIMFGDPYQLPPVVEDGLIDYFESVHKGYYFFNALVWKKTEFKIFELTQVFRQKDPAFKDILNSVRERLVTEDQIERLNVRYGAPVPLDGVITLAPTNSLVTDINATKLAQLPGKARLYTATISGEMKKSAFPTEEKLNLKPGAQIVMLRNDRNGRWVNGTVGKIEALHDDRIEVRINDIIYTLEKETWEEVSYEYDVEKDKIEMKVASSFTQWPLRLAWAMTIHKSQGQTYDLCEVDLTTSTFAHGQMYVALSRCTSLEGLYLKKPVKKKDIIVDPKVIEFMARRETIKIEETPPQEEVTVTEVSSEEPTNAPDIRHDEIEESNAALARIADILTPGHEISDVTIQLTEGRFSRIVAIEILCPSCHSACLDKATGSLTITSDLIGHVVSCSKCDKACIVPLNAFSLQGDVIAREKPTGQASKREKVGRTKKERKSTQGRKTKGDTVREPCQLSLDVKTIQALAFMGVNRSALFEDLLSQYEPFMEALAAIHHEEIAS